MPETVAQSNDSGDTLLQAGIAECLAKDRIGALMMLDLAENLFQKAGESVKAQVTRGWIEQANKLTG